MIRVESSNILGFDYNKKTWTLTVHFKNGSVYDYQKVEPPTVLDVLLADSVGSEFNRLIKAQPDRYPYMRVQ